MRISRAVATIAIDMSSTTVPTATFVTLSAAFPRGASRMQAYNGGAKPIKLYAGKTGATQIPLTLAPGQTSPMMDIEGQLGAADVLKAQSVGADVVAGFLVLNFFG